MYIYRECKAEDYDAIAAIRNQVSVEQETGEGLRKSDAFNAAEPGATVTRLVVEDRDGSIVGYALVAHFAGMVPGRWWIHVTVRPELQRWGIGRQLYHVAENFVRAHGAADVESACVEDLGEKNYAFAVSQGFFSDRKRFEMALDLSTWDSGPVDDCIGKVTTLGLTLGLFPTHTASEQLMRSLYDLVTATEPDVPSFEAVQLGFAEWSAGFLQRKQAVVVAMDGERIVAATFIQLPDDKAAGCYIPYTGVLREYRGRGLARAIKLKAIQAAQEKGNTFVWTHNDQDNPAITRLNLSIGFRQLPGLYRLKKPLG